jgi:predicted dehydrogenase
MVGHCIRFWPEYDAFFKFAHAAEAGRLLSLSMQRRASRPLGSRDNWLQEERRSLGAALDLHIHDTDFIHHLLGSPKSVDSVGTRDAGGLSHIFTDYEFEGMAVQAEGGWNYPAQWGFQMAFQAVFENGVVEFDSRAAQTISVTLGGEAPRPLPFAIPPVGKSVAGEGNISSLGGYYRELEYFIACLEKGKDPEISTGAQAVQSLKTCLAEIRSCAERKRINL